MLGTQQKALEVRNSQRSAIQARSSLGRHRPPLPGLTNGRDSPPHVQPSLLLENPEQVVAVGYLAGNDLFFPLIVGYRKGDLHWLIGGVLLGEVDEFHVESFLLLSLQCHYFFLVPSCEPVHSRQIELPSHSAMSCRGT